MYWKKLLKIPTSGRSPKAESRFNPADLAPFSVFRCNYRFDGDPDILPARRFVCLAHAKHERSDVVITLKATSKLDAYRNNPARMAGGAVYPTGAISFFRKIPLSRRSAAGRACSRAATSRSARPPHLAAASRQVRLLHGRDHVGRE